MKSCSTNRKPMLKKEHEKQKSIEEKEAEAAALAEFVETFEKPSTGLKTFVKGSTINGPVGVAEKNAKNQCYKPSKLQELEEKAKNELIKQPQTKPNITSLKMEKPPKKKKIEKPKSNLEIFKEELKMIQEEREGKLKGIVPKSDSRPKNNCVYKEIMEKEDLSLKKDENYKSHSFGSYDTGDPNTTNIYLGNISPKTTETDLMNVFGKYGSLASVKVMWPRTDEERARNRNCGFVAYMNRKDAERAMKYLQGKDVLGYEMKLGWGKTVPLPPHPVYIPPKLRELTLPPPKSGLPFNAQPDANDLDKLPPPGTPLAVIAKQENFDEILRNSTIKVVMPSDRNILCLIHRMVEFVVREGPMFEAMIMNRELMNPMFRFLFDNQSSEHVYYRWRLFSVLQGEHHTKWRIECFRMFRDGPLWKPPPINPFLQGMPEELIEHSPEHVMADKDSNSHDTSPKPTRGFKESKEKKGTLSDHERETLEDILRELSPEKQKIQDAMIYCIEHADAAEEVVECIVESLSLHETPIHKKIARLYLISDVLHNCTVKVSNASYYRKGFQSRLMNVFRNMHKCYESIEGRMKAEHFKQRVMNCFKAWEDWALYSSDFLIKLQNIFLGLIKTDKITTANEDLSLDKNQTNAILDGLPIDNANDDDDVDGVPMDDDVDGVPIDESVIESSASFKSFKWANLSTNDSFNSKPIQSKWEKEDDIDGVPLESMTSLPASAIKNSNTPVIAVRPCLAQIEHLQQQLNNSSLTEDDRRMKLREIEVKVLKFQDNLESMKDSQKTNADIRDEIDEYRIKLLKRCLNTQKQTSKSPRRRSRSRSSKSSRHRSSSRSRSSRSPSSSSKYKSSRHGSRSPKRHKASKSKSPHRSKRN